jgi:hypothetical protein
MRPRIFKLALCTVLAALTLIPSAPSTPRTVPIEQVARNYPEVRLRKLHLVRPDLIPYPLMFEVYC